MSRRRTAAPEPLCWCPEHASGAPGTLLGHSFYRQEREHGYWRWMCSCGSIGRWQGQSPSVSYHAWEQHVRKVEHV